MAGRVLAGGRGSPCQWSLVPRVLPLLLGSERARRSIMTSNADLSSLLTASKNLTSHLSRPDLPSVQLSLDQIEAQSRHLVSRLPHGDTDRAYVLFCPLNTHSLTYYKKQLSACSSTRRCPCFVKLHCSPQYFSYLYSSSASARY
jgi:hypothetical protein